MSEEYFIEIARRLFLTPSKKVVEDCISRVSSIADDIKLLKSIDTDKSDIYYGKDIGFSAEDDNGIEIENQNLAEDLVKSYGFFNIKDKEE